MDIRFRTLNNKEREKETSIPFLKINRREREAGIRRSDSCDIWFRKQRMTLDLG